MRLAFVPLALVLTAPVWAQESPSYKLTEIVINSGGHPADGTELTSPSHRISLDAIGDSVQAVSLSAASYRLDVGFSVAYPPPGEVVELTFESDEALRWAPERSVGYYHLYRDGLGSLAGGGVCLEPRIPAPSTTDAGVPDAGEGFFYLVTAVNRLREEGTRGRDSSGVPRPDSAACP
jgi:hypothetical protein